MTKTESGLELSVYDDNLPDERQMAVCIKRLQTAFPAMSAGFFNILTERILENRFTSKRLEDAVNHVIDNFQYKELNVSDIIKFDKRAKLLSHTDVCKMWARGMNPDEFEKRMIGGLNYWIRKVDILNLK